MRAVQTTGESVEGVGTVFMGQEPQGSDPTRVQAASSSA